MTPVIAGLLLCLPIAILSSRISDSNSRLFRTPEQTNPPPVLVRANELASTSARIVASPLVELLEDRQLLENHLINVSDYKQHKRGQVDPHLAIARAKIEDAETFEEVMEYLTEQETFAVLNSPRVLKCVVTIPARQPRLLSS